MAPVFEVGYAEVGQAGWQQTDPIGGTYTAAVQSGQVTAGLDFGNMQLSTATPPGKENFAELPVPSPKPEVAGWPATVETV